MPQKHTNGSPSPDHFVKHHLAIIAINSALIFPYGIRTVPLSVFYSDTATALAMAKIAPSVIQEIMRHTKFATTQRYIHPDMTNAHAAINTLGGGR